MATKLGRIVIYLNFLSPIKSNDLVLRYHVTMEKHISTATMLMTTKLGNMITYLEWLIPIKSHNCIITWNRKSNDKLKK